MSDPVVYTAGKPERLFVVLDSRVRKKGYTVARKYRGQIKEIIPMRSDDLEGAKQTADHLAKTTRK